ncbi:hypothetical protein BJV78DRAFT_1172590 [Lactifluus subvellereus]|nr:hypothetical protein BJV78DRAFT_1172590 [Lactifluus subvellereus]
MFRPWHPPAQRAPHSNRPGQRAAPSRARPHSEDAQPNEFVNKRQRCPPAVSSSVTRNQPPRRGGRGTNRPSVTRRDKQLTIWEPTGSVRRPPPPHSGVSATPYSELPPPATGGSGPRHPNAAQPPNDIAPRLGSFPLTPSTPTVDALAPKRRKLESTPPPEIKREFPTEVMAATFTSVSPVSSVTLVGDHKVKRERSISPELSAEPQLIAAGSKRYAPLPPECKQSQPNYRVARNAWARKEQEALKRLGLRVVRTFIREDGMVIDWEATDSEPADTAATIERALLLNDAAIPNPPHQPVVKRSTPSLARMSQGSNRARAGGEASLENRDRRVSGGEFSSHASVGQMSNTSWDPSQEGPSQQQGFIAHTNPGWQTMVNALDPPAHDTPSDHSHLSMYRQATSNIPIFPSSEAWTPSQSLQPPRTASEQRTASPQLTPPLSSPSQRATLRHILQLKRKAGRGSSGLPKPPTISPSPSSSPRKLYPALQTESPSKRSTESFADAVAAVINESARLNRVGSGGTPAPSTPLRLYQKRPSRSPFAHGIERSPMPPSEAGRPARRSLSSGKHSSPPIAVLSPTDSSPESRKVDPASSSAYGDEYDELELSYPSSPMAPPQEALPEPYPPTISPTTLQVSVERAELAPRPSLLSDNRPPSSGENAVIRSAALQYLERYFQTFDTDRPALAEAYAPDAAFSCTPRNVRAQGRDDILDALWALGLGALCSDNKVEYDVTYLGPDIGALLVVLGTISGARDSGEVGYTMNFVLRPERQDRKSPAGNSWPLVATVHQMVLREAPS